MSVFLRTDRLVLREFTRADVDNLVELDSDPRVMQFLYAQGLAGPGQRRTGKPARSSGGCR